MADNVLYPNGNVDFLVYEDAIRQIGVAKITVNDISQITTTVEGAGIMGKIDIPFGGMLEAMGLKIEFSSVGDGALNLCTPEYHTIEWRAAFQYFNPVTRNEDFQQYRYTAVIRPKSMNHGTMATATPADVSGDYSMVYYKVEHKGKKILEIDPLNHIFFMNGKDYASKIKEAIGLM